MSFSFYKLRQERERARVLRIGRVENVIHAEREYQRILERDGDFNANSWLRECYTLLAPYFKGRDNTDIPRTAKFFARQWSGAVRWTASPDVNCPKVAEDYAWRELITKAEEFLAYLNLEFPQGKTIRTAMLRLQDDKWWRKKLNTAIPRIIDQTARKVRQVHGANDAYISQAAYELWMARQSANRKTLDSIVAVNDQGQEFTLLELQEKSVSNPANRRTELMVRCRGMEEYAQSNGYSEAFFITLTAPSKYHSHDKHGVQYANWNYSSPRVVNDYLNVVWARIRAQLSRDMVDYYGVRVVEPHHDGCPHWHLLIFAKGYQVGQYFAPGGNPIEYTFRKYALQEDGEEKGAAKHRVKFDRIDDVKGSATGYIAKYISKNIDGYGLDGDLLEGRDSESTAQRIRSWASTWGIRQFQFFGTAAIGPYRELRRIRNRKVPEAYERATAAADVGEFADYLSQADIYQFECWRPWLDRETGEILGGEKNQFDEDKPPKIRGVLAIDPCNGLPFEGIVTRLMTWAIEDEYERQRAASVARSIEDAEPWTCVSNCTVEDWLDSIPADKFANSPPDYRQADNYRGPPG